MENTEQKLHKPSSKDTFDLNLLIRGFLYQLPFIRGNNYEYAYYFTFKRSMKAYAHEFSDPWEMMIDSDQFFLNTGDPVVVNCCKVSDSFTALEVELCNRFGIDNMEVVLDPVARYEGERYKPFRSCFKRLKNYKRLKIQYEGALQDYIDYLYRIGCVITTGKYRILPIFNRYFAGDEEASLRLLNDDDHIIVLIKRCIGEVRGFLNELKELDNKKGKKLKVI